MAEKQFEDFFIKVAAVHLRIALKKELSDEQQVLYNRLMAFINNQDEIPCSTSIVVGTPTPPIPDKKPIAISTFIPPDDPIGDATVKAMTEEMLDIYKNKIRKAIYEVVSDDDESKIDEFNFESDHDEPVEEIDPIESIEEETNFRPQPPSYFPPHTTSCGVQYTTDDETTDYFNVTSSNIFPINILL